MSDTTTVVLALRVVDAALADRLAAALAGVAQVRLARDDEIADAVIVDAAVASPGEGLGDATDDRLTPREREVLGYLAQGASNKAIARALGISPHTAKFHVGSLLDKLDATGRTDAVAQAARLGLIHL